MATKKQIAAKAVTVAREFYEADAVCWKLARHWNTPEGVDARLRYKAAIEAVANLGDGRGADEATTTALRGYAISVKRGDWHAVNRKRAAVYSLPKRVCAWAIDRGSDGAPAGTRKRERKQTLDKLACSVVDDFENPESPTSNRHWTNTDVLAALNASGQKVTHSQLNGRQRDGKTYRCPGYIKRRQKAGCGPVSRKRRRRCDNSGGEP